MYIYIYTYIGILELRANSKAETYQMGIGSNMFEEQNISSIYSFNFRMSIICIYIYIGRTHIYLFGDPCSPGYFNGTWDGDGTGLALQELVTQDGMDHPPVVTIFIAGI